MKSIATIGPNIEEIRLRAAEVASLLKALSHPNRLRIACEIMDGEFSVSEISKGTGVRQPVLSRELARLRSEGIVSARRDAKLVYYKLTDPRIVALISALCLAFSPSRTVLASKTAASAKGRSR